MTAFLTSHIGGSYKKDGKRFPAPLNRENGLVDNLKSRWNRDFAVLIISADPNAIQRNAEIRDCLAAAFPMSGLPVSEVIICDRRNERIIEHLTEYPVVILSGGHVPTQNAYFQKLNLRKRLEAYDGILIGISAGSMNSAETVYAHPEIEGEAIDPYYRRFLPGLGITKAMVLPHYQAIRDDVLDGLRVFEDIAYPDSMGREFYALTDGSYLLVENGITEVHGEAYLIQDGLLRQFCCKNEMRTLP